MTKLEILRIKIEKELEIAHERLRNVYLESEKDRAVIHSQIKHLFNHSYNEGKIDALDWVLDQSGGLNEQK